MEIRNEKGTFDLDDDCSIQIERTNPLLSDQGSLSLPFTFKRTPRNERLLDFPARHDRRQAYLQEQDVNIQAGIFNEIAKMDIEEIDDHIEGTFYLFESTFYSRIKETNLSAVFKDSVRYIYGPPLSVEDRVRLTIQKFEEMIQNGGTDLSEDYAIFPAIINCELKERAWESKVGAEIKRQEYMNQIYWEYEGTNVKRRLAANSSYTYTDDSGNEITLPIGYGISPFLRVGYILKKIFAHFGLTLEANYFDSTPQGQKWCVLNNTMDAILPGHIIESQLVPDCSVNDFLDIVREGCCGDFFIDTVHKTARLVLFKDVVEQAPDIDLTDYLTKPQGKLKLQKPKQVRLTINKNLPYAGTATPTFEEIERKYPHMQPITDTWGFGKNGVLIFETLNSIWKLSEGEKGWIWSTYRSDWISSMNFDYDTSDELEREVHTIPGEALATMEVTLDGSGPVIGSMRNMNSYVFLETGKMMEEKVECPIMLSLQDGTKGMQNQTELSSFDPVSLLLWTEYGLFNTFWKKYDELLRTSFHTLIYRAKLPAHMLHNFRFDRLKIIDGQPLIPVALRYSLSNKPMLDVEMEFRTVKVYE